MIDRTNLEQQLLQSTPYAPSRKVLKMVHNERMGGSMPVWETLKTSTQNIEASLSQAQNTNTHASQNHSAYAPSRHNPQSDQSAAFGFGDLVDMVNPMHHIPVIGYAYRKITGDDIKPIGQIVGGAIFGGALGAAGGLINAIVENETGNSIEDNAITLAFGNNERTTKTGFNPETSNALLAFSDLSHTNDILIERANKAPIEYSEQERPIMLAEAAPAREPLAQTKPWKRSSYNA